MHGPLGSPVKNWPLVGSRPEAADDGPSVLLRATIRFVLRHKIKLVAWLLAGALLAALYARSVPPSYTANATLLLEPSRQAVAPSEPPSFNLLRADSELQVMRSERLLTQVFESLNLASDPELQPRPPSWFRLLLAEARRPIDMLFSLLPAPSSSRAPASEWRSGAPGETAFRAEPRAADEARRIAFSNFAKRFSARRVGQSYAVELSYFSADPAHAARVANAAASAYVLQSVMFKADAARSGAEALQGRVDALGLQVAAADAAVRAGGLPDRPTPDADARIIGAAQEPLSPSAPRTTLIIALGGFLGLFGGLGAAALQTVLDRRVRTADALTRETGLACLAVVPKLKNGSGSPHPGGVGRNWLTVSHPESAFAGAIRDLRTSIKLVCGSSHGDEHHIIALASCSPDSGCSLLCMNIAHLMQRGGKTVTVIDADLHGPSTKRRGTTTEANGSLVELLAKDAGDDQIAFTNMNGVALLPAQSARSRAQYFVEFPGQRFTKILRAARSSGDVLLDLPVISASANSRAAAMHADAVVIVVRAGRTTVEEIMEADRSLRAAGANVIGAVINYA